MTSKGYSKRVPGGLTKPILAWVYMKNGRVSGLAQPANVDFFNKLQGGQRRAMLLPANWEPGVLP